MAEDNNKIMALTKELEVAQREVDKWRTGAEIYEAKVTDLQEAMQELIAELDRLTLENQQLKASQTAGAVADVALKQATQPIDNEQAIIQRALISRIQQLEAQLGM